MTRFFSEPDAWGRQRRAPSFEPEVSSDPYDRSIPKHAGFLPPPPALPEDPREIERLIDRRRVERGAQPIFQRKHGPLIRDAAPPPPPALPEDPREIERLIDRRRVARGARPVFQRKHGPLIRDVSPSTGADAAPSRDAENVQVARGLGGLLRRRRSSLPPPIPGQASEDGETDREADSEADRTFPNLYEFFFGSEEEEEESQARPNVFPQSDDDGDAEDEKPGARLPSVPDVEGEALGGRPNGNGDEEPPPDGVAVTQEEREASERAARALQERAERIWPDLDDATRRRLGDIDPQTPISSLRNAATVLLDGATRRGGKSSSVPNWDKPGGVGEAIRDFHRLRNNAGGEWTKPKPLDGENIGEYSRTQDGETTVIWRIYAASAQDSSATVEIQVIKPSNWSKKNSILKIRYVAP